MSGLFPRRSLACNSYKNTDCDSQPNTNIPQANRTYPHRTNRKQTRMLYATELYPNAEVGNAVHEYCIEHSTPVPKHIDEHRQATIEFCEKEKFPAIMMINTLQVYLHASRPTY